MKYKGLLALILLQMTQVNLVNGQSYIQQYVDKSASLCEKGECDSAIYYLRIGISKNRNNKSPDSLSILYLKLGNAYLSMSNYVDAFKAYSESERFSLKTKNEEELAKIYITWIEYYRKRQKYDKANDYIKLMNDLLSKSQVSLNLVGSFYSRCAAVEMEGNHDIKKAREYSFKVLSIAQEINDKDLSATAYNEIGYTFENKDNIPEALKYYNLASQEWENIGNYRSMTDAILNIARCETRIKNYKLAIDTYKRGILLCDTFNLIEPKIALLYNLHLLYASINEYQLALDTYKTYDNLMYLESIKKKEKELYEIEQKYQLEKQVAVSNQEKQRAELAESEAKNKANQVYSWSVFSVLLIFSLLAVTLLLYRLKSKNRILNSINRDLEHSIDQKAVIFKELHHRVKNNLTLLKSILYLHAKSSSNETIKQVLMDCQSRIDSMSIVHKNLYEANDFTQVKLSGFINELIGELENSMLPFDKKINATIEENGISVDMTNAVFLGFVINELVTNSIKYGTNENGEVVVGITIQQKADRLHFKYWDEGKGLKTGEFVIQEGGFGFKLIEIMMRQLSSMMIYSIQSGKPTFEFTINRSQGL